MPSPSKVGSSSSVADMAVSGEPVRSANSVPRATRAARIRRNPFGCMVHLRRVVQADKIFEVFGNPERLFDAWGSLLPAPQVSTSCMARTHSSQSAVSFCHVASKRGQRSHTLVPSMSRANSRPCPRRRCSSRITDQPDTARSSVLSQVHPCGSARRKRRSRSSQVTSWPSPPPGKGTPRHHGAIA